MPYSEAVARTKTALQDEGFGILCEIDLKAKFKEKLGVDYTPYVILGACNPPLAYKAVQAEQDIGLLLPCNVIVYESNGSSVVAAINPDSMVAMVGHNPRLEEVANDARERLERAINRI